MSEARPSSLRLPLPASREDAEGLLKPLIEEEEMRLWDYWRMLRRHLRLITLLCVGAVIATALSLLMQPPVYTAETTLLIERNTPHVLDIREVLLESQGADEYDFYRTQYEILKSRTLAAWVIEEQESEAKALFAEKN